MSAKAAKRARTKSKQIVRDMCERYVRELRAILKANASRAEEVGRSPCHTCAFQPKTDSWAGFDRTMLQLAAAVETGQTFYCHENLPKAPGGIGWEALADRSQMITCAGWEMVKDDPQTRLAWVRVLVNREDVSDEDIAWVAATMQGEIGRICGL